MIYLALQILFWLILALLAGIYTFKQVAMLEPDVIEQLGDTFGSFSDRIIREDWVGQAKKLNEIRYGNKS